MIFTPEFYAKYKWSNPLNNAVVYDIETFPNTFTLNVEELCSDVEFTFEISTFKDDRLLLFQWFNMLQSRQVPMIGFNTINFDYPVIHHIFKNPHITVQEIYAFAMNLINSQNRFGNTIWESDRFTPQIDLFKIHHFDNKAKTTSLKALQINMRSETVVETPVPFGTELTRQQIDDFIIPYNKHDVKKTKEFAYHSFKALEFRAGLRATLQGDVFNFNDTKIGAKILEQRLGDDICYTRSSGRKEPRQTVRHRIALADIIFPYIRFQHPEFVRVLDYMRSQVLTPDDLEDPDAPIKTKGVFKGLVANIDGIEFGFGTGGIHGSILNKRFYADDEWLIRDIDVKGLYPSIAIVNRLAPAHLGEAFTREYALIPIERAKYAKGTVENGSYKLAGNGTYGNSNNKFSVFYDPQFTMTITINGQLMLCMLAEWLMTVPTLQIIQINTDGITYRIHKSMEPQAAAICKQWEAFTLLDLEDADYSRMWIRDVNNYIAETTSGKLKQKGAYWHPKSGDEYADSISESSPPAWHKDLGNLVSIKAAVAAMVHGVPVEQYIRFHTDPFDFMLRVKVDRASNLMLGQREIQRTSRYYVARNGEELKKISPPAKGANVGDWKRRNGITDVEFNRIAATLAPGEWSELIHTKNKSKYEIREMGIEAGWKVAECNNSNNFQFDNLNYDYYITEANKLLIG
jgi:hypothetical protein